MSASLPATVTLFVLTKSPHTIRNVGEPSQQRELPHQPCQRSGVLGCVEEGLTNEAALRVVNNTGEALKLAVPECLRSRVLNAVWKPSRNLRPS